MLDPLSLAQCDILRTAGINPDSVVFHFDTWDFHGCKLDGSPVVFPVSLLVDGMKAMMTTPEGKARLYEKRVPPKREVPRVLEPEAPALVSAESQTWEPCRPSSDCEPFRFPPANPQREYRGITSAEDRVYENPDNWRHI